MKTMHFIVPTLIAALAVSYTVVRAGNENPRSSQSAERSQTNSAIEVMFFMNPSGMPCKMQDKVLKDADTELFDLAGIRYVKTTRPEDRSLFYSHGVRALPMMLIVKDGKEAYRFSPGIHSSDDILAAVKRVRG